MAVQWLLRWDGGVFRCWAAALTQLRLLWHILGAERKQAIQVKELAHRPAIIPLIILFHTGVR